MSILRTLQVWFDWLARRLSCAVEAPANCETFDDLVSAIVGGFQRASCAVHERALGTLESLISFGDSAAPGLVNIDTAAVGAGEASIFPVPLVGLAMIRLPELATLSLEFDCVIEHLRRGEGGAVAVRMVCPGTRGAYCMKIEVSAQERLIAQVTLNDELIRRHEIALDCAAPPT